MQVAKLDIRILTRSKGGLRRSTEFVGKEKERNMRSVIHRRKTGYCRIFCNLKKKAEDEVPYYVSLQDGVFGGSHILIFSVSRSGYYSFIHHLSEPEKNATLAEVIPYRAQFSYLRLSVDMAMTQRPKYFPQSKNCVVDYKKIWPEFAAGVLRYAQVRAAVAYFQIRFSSASVCRLG